VSAPHVQVILTPISASVIAMHTQKSLSTKTARFRARAPKRLSSYGWARWLAHLTMALL
jgi:hypothetical protein